ncbi:RNA exonuclease 4 [Octopus bimaculoides]|uniref:RNA exonuclease 4 n=1 Tax=Octopus bimaculoides TaxID=37653 RepID=A0A0L8H7R5_OCTBM|nr:RNA exonuclease 4 [Octopus bimaculoides]|eukprot:XP_014775037.1 PREDICTED: RNA exonuclease 4-like [Octopus bimaculoides]
MKLHKTASKTPSGPSSSSSVPRTFNSVGKKKKNFKYKNTKNDKNNNKHDDKRHGKFVHKSKQKWKRTKKKKKVNEKEKKTVLNGDNEKKTKDVDKRHSQTNKSMAEKTESGGIGLCYIPTDPAECSSNWKKLSATILGSSLQEETTTDKKKKLIGVPDSQLKVVGIHGNVLLNGNSVQKSNVKKKEEKMQETSIIKKADIWFDDVDEALIEPAALCEEPVESEMKLIQATASSKVTTCVAVDCEMVGTGESGNDDMLARVSVVNQYGHCLYDKYVKPMAEITDYRTRFSGITPNLLKDGTEFKTVQKDVGDFIKDHILVGHALHNDFKVLYMDHPKQLIRDTAKYKPFRKLNRSHTPSLKMLAREVLGITIQQGSHNSVIDAQVAMKLYMKHRKDWESRLKHKKLKLKQKRKQMKETKKKNKVKK